MALAADPSETFALFLERYGLRFLAHDRKVLFLPALILERLDRSVETHEVLPDLMKRLGVDRTPEGIDLAFDARIMLTETEIRLAWPFVINKTAYLADVPH